MTTTSSRYPAATDMATVVRTAKGFTLTWNGEAPSAAYGNTLNIGPNFTHAVVFATGGWVSRDLGNTGWAVSRHKSLDAAEREAAKQAACQPLAIIDLTAIPA